MSDLSNLSVSPRALILRRRRRHTHLTQRPPLTYTYTRSCAAPGRRYEDLCGDSSSSHRAGYPIGRILALVQDEEDLVEKLG